VSAHEFHATREQRTILAVVSAASFLNPFLSSSLNLAIPAIGAELGVSAVALNWVVTAFLVASAAFLVPFGRVADRIGRRRAFLVGMVLQSGFTLACAFAGSSSLLIALRFLQGAGSGMAFATATAILVSAFPPAHRGRVLGISTAAVYVGLSVGPVLGGLITHHLGWRAVFALSAGLGLLVTLVGVAGISGRDDRLDNADVDPAGAALYTGSLLVLMAGVSTLRSWSLAPWLVAAGVVLLGVFCANELRVKIPTLDIRLFSNLVFAFSNLAALINYSATFAVGFLLSLYLQAARGLDARAAGMILLAQPIVMAILSPWAGRLSDRSEPRLVASLGMLLTFVALALFATLEVATPLALVVAPLLLIGVGFGLFSSPNTNAVMSAVEPRDYSVAAAILGTMRLVGQAMSMAVVAALLAAFMGGRRIGPESVPALLASTRVAFSLFAALCLVGVFASLARGRMHG
jgi:EmrB/QacA subfamily drug resistance transporter